MADLEFERRMNPWLFDSSGNLTADAKKQFPDLAAAAAGPVAPVTVPAAGGGQTVTTNPAMLRTASNNAAALQGSVRTECGQPWEHVNSAVSSLMGLNLCAGLNNAWSVWQSQTHALEQAIGNISQNLQTTAQNYEATEASIHSQFAQKHD
ncbi:hypothetical protein OH807_36240 [Kitasatospora sp. NBC_01560]|uniref:hypothetical protein n=1 Tax=Kitasatospora sp. NBC_01560 TaxID=2975965 RepID=UPI0038647DF1